MKTDFTDQKTTKPLDWTTLVKAESRRAKVLSLLLILDLFRMCLHPDPEYRVPAALAVCQAQAFASMIMSPGGEAALRYVLWNPNSVYPGSLASSRAPPFPSWHIRGWVARNG